MYISIYFAGHLVINGPLNSNRANNAATNICPAVKASTRIKISWANVIIIATTKNIFQHSLSSLKARHIGCWSDVCDNLTAITF